MLARISSNTNHILHRTLRYNLKPTITQRYPSAIYGLRIQNYHSLTRLSQISARRAGKSSKAAQR